MKKRNLFAASAILSMALSLPVYAGDVQTPTGPTPPPPPPPAATSEGSMNTPSPGASEAANDNSSDLFIELLLSVFSLY
ncbi:MAG TPA: hypothetical protein VE135_00105 [Pyrinomonadaceae bacterium]|nr:hypothetical protein [Pyrinomonadaceae bacterium]